MDREQPDERQLELREQDAAVEGEMLDSHDEGTMQEGAEAYAHNTNLSSQSADQSVCQHVVESL